MTQYSYHQPPSPFHIVLKPRRCRDCPKIQDFIHAPPIHHPPPPFTKLPVLLWHLVILWNPKQSFETRMCHGFHDILNLGKLWRAHFSNIVQHEYGGQSSVPSLSWRFANILMGFVNLPLCISELPLFAEAKIQNKSPGHLYISIQVGKEKRNQLYNI